MTDFIHDNDFNLIIKDGDFAIGESNDQETEQILVANRGSFRQWPLIGCDLIDLVNGPASVENLNALRRTVNLQMAMDNKRITYFSLPDFENIELVTEPQ